MGALRLFSKSVLIAINAVLAAALLLSYLAAHISPLKVAFLPFFGIGFGTLLFCNLLFIVFWLFVKRRLALISFITIALGANHLFAYFQPIPIQFGKAPEGKSIKVLSHNVRLFGWYNWRTNLADRDSMFARLQKIDADVMCFQEFFHHSEPGTFEVRHTLRTLLKAKYLYEEVTATVHDNQHYGIAILSKYPILQQGRIDFAGERSNVCIYTDIDVDGDTVRVYNAHVASIRFSDENYQFIEEIMNQPREGNAQLKEGVNIIERLASAYRNRAVQIGSILEHMESSPHPIIFCGDMNDTPVSYTYGRLSRNLVDSFRRGGWGIGNTYIGRFPSFRIDYIFHDKRFDSRGYTTHDEAVSDHHAISTRIYLRPH